MYAYFFKIINISHTNKLFDEDFNGYVCEEYNYDKKTEEWEIFMDTCELYAKLLADN